MKEYVLVPQSHLDKLEEARLELYKMFENADTYKICLLTNITQPMWVLTHKRYEKISK